MKILILSAYNAVSHDALNRGLVKHIPEVEFTVLSLPPRYFAWRSRGNSLSFAYENRADLTAGYDRIFATSYTDITGLRGLVPEMAEVPVTVYFHENQFAYPENSSAHGTVEAKIVSVYNALAAERVVFNTAFNMETFIKGAEKFLKKMPDHVPAGLMDSVRGKSEVLHVPIEKPGFRCDKSGRPVILWSHRWEYDKGPERFLMALRVLKQRGFDFGLHMAGQTFRKVPEAFNVIKHEFADRLLSFGYPESRAEYEKVISESSIVVSTSMHEFQGLSVMEAAAAGCVPVLPDRFAYPELFDGGCLYASSDSPEKDAENCADAVIRLWGEKPDCDMSPYYWGNLKNRYKELF